MKNHPLIFSKQKNPLLLIKSIHKYSLKLSLAFLKLVDLISMKHLLLYSQRRPIFKWEIMLSCNPSFLGQYLEVLMQQTYK